MLNAPRIHNAIFSGNDARRVFAVCSADPETYGLGDYNGPDSIDYAIDAGELAIFLKPGTYNRFTADVASSLVVGSGKGTVINGGTSGHAVTISGTDVEIARFAVQTTSGGGNNYDGVAISARCMVKGIIGISSDRHFISIADGGDDSIVVFNRSISSDDDGIYIANGADNCVVGGNRLDGWTNEGIDDDTTGPTTTTFGNDTD